MKKYVIGFIVGALVMASGQVAADTISKVGKKIQGEAVVIIDGKTASSAIIVDAKSYAPVRDIAESLGATASYEKGVITIEKELDDATVEQLRSLRAEKDFTDKQIGKLKTTINNLENTLIPQTEERYANAENETEKEYTLKEVEAYQALVTKNKIELATLEAQLAEINAQIAELEGAN